MAEGYPPDEREEQPVHNVFRQVEKFYRTPVVTKRKQDQKYTDYTNIIDFTNLDHNSPENRGLIQEVTIQPKSSNYFQPFTKAYTVASVPGTCNENYFILMPQSQLS